MRLERTQVRKIFERDRQLMGEPLYGYIQSRLAASLYPEPYSPQTTLSPTDVIILSGLSEGKEYEEIAPLVDMDPKHAKTHMHRAAGPLRKLSAVNTLHAVLLAINQGLIPMPERTPEQLARYDTLSLRHIDVLEVLTKEQGKYNPDKSIAIELEIAEGTVHRHMKEIFRRTKTNGRTITAIGYIQWKQAKESESQSRTEANVDPVTI